MASPAANSLPQKIREHWSSNRMTLRIFFRIGDGDTGKRIVNRDSLWKPEACE
jgi:hypothetical protein